MKTLLATLFLSIFSFSALSTHIMGGEITAENNGGNDYNVLLTIYRDTIGIPTGLNQNFSVFDDSGTNIMNFSMIMDQSANHPIFGFQNGSLLPYFPYGVEIYFFSKTITLPPSSKNRSSLMYLLIHIILEFLDCIAFDTNFFLIFVRS